MGLEVTGVIFFMDSSSLSFSGIVFLTGDIGGFGLLGETGGLGFLGATGGRVFLGLIFCDVFAGGLMFLPILSIGPFFAFPVTGLGAIFGIFFLGLDDFERDRSTLLAKNTIKIIPKTEEHNPPKKSPKFGGVENPNDIP